MNGNNAITRYECNSLFFRRKAPYPLKNDIYFVSIISELELLSYLGINSEDEAKIQAFLKQVEIVNLTPEIIKTTISIRRKHKLKLPDSIIIGTAKALKLEILSNDVQIAKIDEVICRKVEIV